AAGSGGAGRVSGIHAITLEAGAPGIAAAGHAARGLLPLRLGGETLAHPPAVRGRLGPADDRHRVFRLRRFAEGRADRQGARARLDADAIAGVRHFYAVDPEG